MHLAINSWQNLEEGTGIFPKEQSLPVYTNRSLWALTDS